MGCRVFSFREIGCQMICLDITLIHLLCEMIDFKSARKRESNKQKTTGHLRGHFNS
jgi:hypothetical protein